MTDITETDTVPTASGNNTAQEDVERDALARREACGKAIEAALKEHQCQIVPVLSIDPVGDTGSRGMVEASWNLQVIIKQQQ